MLDRRGAILAVNKSWKDFARRNGDPLLRKTSEGVNYFRTCRTAKGEDAPIARAALAGIRAVIRGERTRFFLEYPCHSPRKKRWFLMYATRARIDQGHAVVSHVNITERKLAEQFLRQTHASLESEVKRRTATLVQTNARLEREIASRLKTERMLRHNELKLRDAMTEQERISQDLHDSILQSLYAVGLGLQTAEPLLAEDQHEASGHIRAAVDQLNFTIREVRGYIVGLESTLLERGSLTEALRTLVTLLGRNSGIDFRLSLSNRAARHLSQAQVRHLLQIAREAVSNILRHAGATKAWLTLARQRGETRLEIRDNGVGMRRSGARRGRGLDNMSRRAEEIHAHLSVESERLKGTRVTVVLCRLTDSRVDQPRR